MRFTFVNGIRNRLFKKIFLLFITAFIVTMAYLILSYRYFFLSRRFPKIMKNSVNHVELLIKEIGEPFNIRKAETISKKLGIQIRFDSKHLNWASGKSINGVDTQHLRSFLNRPDIKVGFTDIGPAIRVNRDEGTYLFTLHSERENFRNIATLFLISFIFFISIVITGMYFVIKRMLRPVRILEEGVMHLGSGDIDHKLNVKSIDEFGKLAESFNSMSSEIKKMIKAKDQLLLDVSHELRSPLTRIKVALEFIENSEAKKSISDDISDLEKMVKELLETERLNSSYGSLKKEQTDLGAFIDNVIKEFQWEKPGIKFYPPENKTIIEADRERLKILLKNIIENALKFSSDQQEPVEIHLEKSEEYTTVKITDYGGGISKKELQNIFEPFYRIDKSRSKDTGGYGLGMSLSKKIIESHKGEISIESSQGEGTTVFLKFKNHIG